jgi:hypothetical protein
MAKPEGKPMSDLDLDEAFDEFEDLADDDYVFVVNADGTLKNVLLPPEEAFEYSEKLMKVFNALGIDNPEILSGDRTLH